ncbi:MAG: DNA repair protein RecO [Francisellaceae bacterium]|nr:DNA repair protein RecO [Francisellaceae bacterium]MBT6207832.1 DNA repair protein RecO [Francisellaceae bacterium]
MTFKLGEILLISAYVLHTRKYRETSLLVDFFTKTQGKISCVANGARRPKSQFNGLIQPFQPLLISWKGKRDLHTLVYAEQERHVPDMYSTNIFSAYYLNELLMKSLAKEDPYEDLFLIYDQTLDFMQNKKEEIDFIIRIFEINLMKNLGYNLPLNYDIEGLPIDDKARYEYKHEQGFIKSTEGYLGEALKFLDQCQYNKSHLLAQKKLMRQVIANILGHELYTRKVYSKILGYVQ